MARSLFSYIVRFDSGFAPNPFHGYCTLATCKPLIRDRAEINDWLVGTGSNAKNIRHGGHLVYAMRVTEILSTKDYWADPRFEDKKPNLHYNWIAASGDNIYEPLGNGQWRQLGSYHSLRDGSASQKHIARDTGVPKVLISDDFVYFGGEGPQLPTEFCQGGKANLLLSIRNYQRVRQEETIAAFENWLRSLGVHGYQGKPWDWVARRI
ncbi:MAG: hypothetical protein OXI24_07545 [Candidatus Poribacteria bacterium]|nr:hypothetical protein [Candidatus Poribacteria bacterium]